MPSLCEHLAVNGFSGVKLGVIYGNIRIISKKIQKQVGALGFWSYRKVLKIPWVHRISSKEVLMLVNEERSFVKTIRQRQLRFLGHSEREENIEELTTIEGKVEEERARGRQRPIHMDGLTSVVAGNWKASDIIHTAQDRKRFQNMVVNVRI